MTDIDRMIYEKQFQKSPVANYDTQINESDLDDDEIYNIVSHIGSLKFDNKTIGHDKGVEYYTEAAPDKLVVNSREDPTKHLSRQNLKQRWIPWDDAEKIYRRVRDRRMAQRAEDNRNGIVGMAALEGEYPDIPDSETGAVTSRKKRPGRPGRPRTYE